MGNPEQETPVTEVLIDEDDGLFINVTAGDRVIVTANEPGYRIQVPTDTAERWYRIWREYNEMQSELRQEYEAAWHKGMRPFI